MDVLVHSIVIWFIAYAADICLFKVNSKNTRKRCEICSELTIMIPERRYGIFIINFVSSAYF